MSNEITKTNGAALVPAINTPEAERFIKLYICDKAQPKDLKEIQMQLFVNGYTLADVIAKKVHILPFYEGGQTKYCVVVSIHEMIAKADATGTLDGIEVTSDGSNGEKPTWAQTTVWKKGCSHPFTKKVFFAEYNRPKFRMWMEKPITMLEKTSTAHALRLAGFTSLLEESEVEVVEDTRPSEEALNGLEAVSAPNDTTKPHNPEEKVAFLKRCESAFSWMKKHKVSPDQYMKVFGDLGYEKPEQVSNIEHMNTITEQLAASMREIIAAGTNKLPEAA